MSDNPNDRPPDEAPDPVPPPEPVVDAPAPETPPAEPTDPPAPASDATVDPGPAKPSQADRRFARLSAKADADRALLAQTQRELAAARALLDGKADGDTPAAPTKPDPNAVDQAARQLVAERDFASRLNSLIETGTKEIGKETFDEKSRILVELGARESPAFMQALVEIPGAHKVVVALADDADRLVALLDKSPVAMAAELGRMAAELNAPKPPKAVSQAPAPMAPVGAGQPRGEPDMYDTKSMTQEEYNTWRRKTAPVSLGGEGRRAS